MALLLTVVNILLLALRVNGACTGEMKASAETEIDALGASVAVGGGSGIAEHSAVITVQGGPGVPALLNVVTGSEVTLEQQAANTQQTQINADGSSEALQTNTAANSGSASEYLTGDIQGLQVDIQTSGWSAFEGQGLVGQVDIIEHEQESDGGWGQPRP